MLVNDFNSINKEIVEEIAQSVKKLNIVTNHIDRFKKIQDNLYNEFGIVLNISNNKKSSLIKSEIIINLDFPQELINQYNIYNKAIIINILEKIFINKKKFNGVNINYFRIVMPDKYKLEEFCNEIVYESIIYKYKDLSRVRNTITKDKIAIKKLIGNNGPVQESEII